MCAAKVSLVVGWKFVNKSEESGLPDHHPLNTLHSAGNHSHKNVLLYVSYIYVRTVTIQTTKQTKPKPSQGSDSQKRYCMRCHSYLILHTGCIQSPIYHCSFFNNPLNCLVLLILHLQHPVCCLLCCLVYSILSSWISMELCIFPYQHRRGPRPTRAQKGLTVYSVGHRLPSKRGLSFHIFLSSSPLQYNHLGGRTNVGICAGIRSDRCHLAAIIGIAPSTMPQDTLPLCL